MSVIIVPTIKFKPGKSAAGISSLQKDMFAYTGPEEGNASYYFFKGVESLDADTVSAFEEYESAAVCDKHVKSAALAQFGKAITAEGAEIDLGFYNPELGFVTRDASASAEGHNDGAWRFVWIAKLTCKDGAARTELLKLARPLVEYVHESEPKTLSYLFTSARDNETDVLVFEQYENKQALTNDHHSSQQFKDFFAQVGKAGLVTGKETKGYETFDNCGWLAKRGFGAQRL